MSLVSHAKMAAFLKKKDAFMMYPLVFPQLVIKCQQISGSHQLSQQHLEWISQF